MHSCPTRRSGRSVGQGIPARPTEARSDYSLILTFQGGERRRFDMAPYLNYPVFQPLRNPAFFSLAKVDYGTATWPGDIDIAPETLYLESIPEPLFQAHQSAEAMGLIGAFTGAEDLAENHRRYVREKLSEIHNAPT
ncbi:DUF2442 domain-containing protein [Methylomagnum sp.]